MIFINKPAGGPDAVGGLWPDKFDAVARNRTGGTVSKGQVCMSALLPGIATEVATNDSNSYLPGYSNDTVWNTVVLPTAGGIKAGFYAAVCLEDSIADNGIGKFRYFGIVEDAFVTDGSGSNTQAGNPLTITTAKVFDAVILSNESVYGWYVDVQGTNSNSVSNNITRRVFLHNGFAPKPTGQTF